MSLYEQLIQEGIERGIEQGAEQVNRKAVKALVKLNMTAEQIAAVLELPVDRVQQYRQEA